MSALATLTSTGLPFDRAKVHGLKPIDPRRLKLPIELSGEQRAYTCPCGKGWLTITSSVEQARELLRAHIAEG